MASGLEDRVKDATKGVGNAAGNVARATAGYIKDNIIHKFWDGLIQGGATALAATAGYFMSAGALLPTLGWGTAGNLAARIVTFPYDVYKNLKSMYTAGKTATGGEEKKKEEYHGSPAGLQHAYA